MKLFLTFLFLLFHTSWSQDPVTDFWGKYNPHEFPLNVQVVKEWQDEKGNYQLVIYDLGKLNGTNKSASPKIAAYYGYPKGAKNVPGIVQIHGGGQRANKSRVQSWVELGFACISINWGGRVLEQADTPNTDWDGLAAGFIRPGVTKADELDHHNTVKGGKNTLFKEAHLLNSSWNLIALSARRALTFLEERPEVDKTKLGVEGHSMGGRSTVLTAIDPRIKAASPSVGGSGFLYQDMWGLKGSARRMKAEDGLDLYQKTVSAQAYWPHIKAPTLFLGSTNDFNSPTELVIKGMSLLPDQSIHQLAMAPHLNHRFTTGTDNARFLWMVSHLQNDFEFPKQSKATLNLKNETGIPVFTVKVDRSTKHKVQKVDIYYGYARDPRIRFWRSAKAHKVGDTYAAHCPVFDTNEPLFAFANITYEIDKSLPGRPGHPASNVLTLSSNYLMAYPDELKRAGVKAIEKPRRLVDNFSNDMQDWYILNGNNPHHWFYSTRKLLDPSWMGPKGGKLSVELETTEADNTLGVVVQVNTWQGYTGRRQDTFYALVKLENKGKNSFQLSPKDFKNEKGQSLVDWDEITELSFTSSKRLKGKFAGKEEWKGKALVLSKISWDGGKVIKRLHPHEIRKKTSVAKVRDFDSEFQKAIDDSVELEEKDETLK